MENNNLTTDIKAAVEARLKEEEEALKSEGKKDDGGITLTFVSDCLIANERGDGALFAALHKGRFIFDKTSSQWYHWAGHHWERDRKEDAHRLVEEVALVYLKAEAAENFEERISKARQSGMEDLAKNLEKRQASYFSRVKKLRSIAGAQNCLTWAHRVEEGLSICGEDFDRNPWLLACRNGVIELRTGRFRPGRPEDFLTKAAPHEWKGIDHPALYWEGFLNAIFAAGNDLSSYVGRLFGYGITGLAVEHILPVLHGAGRNGKGTLVETLRYILGTLAQPIQSEMLLDQRSARSSSGPSPDIMALKGLRIAFASETDEGRKFSTSKAKWLSGGDTLTGRNPHDKYETIFEPTHLLCLLTNHLPHAPGDDFAFWQRMHLIPFNVRFVDNPTKEDERQKDKNLPERLKGEASGILAWLVRGCIEWQKQGLNPPLIVRAATEQYRMSEDLLAGFIEGRCYPPEDTGKDMRTLYKELYASFAQWYEATIGDPKYCPQKGKFSQIVEKRFTKRKDGGNIYFYGIALNPALTED